MNHYLFVGDVHATPSSLSDCEKLFDLIIQTVKEDKTIKKVVFLGDLHHTHAIVRLEVVDFYLKQFKRLSEIPGVSKFNVILLTGNHDRGNNAGSDASVLSIYEQLTTVITNPVVLGGVGYMPYIHNPDDFVKKTNSLNVDTVICHQSFVGAKFENNFPVADGVDINQIAASKILSGHIHMFQSIGNNVGKKVLYPGTPRHMIKSDVNQEKNIFIIDMDTLDITRKVSTSICSVFHEFEITEQQLFPDLSNVDLSKDRVYLKVTGSKKFVDEKIKEFNGKGFLISTYIEEQEDIQIKESEGLNHSLKKYIIGKEWLVNSDVLWKELCSRIGWLG